MINVLKLRKAIIDKYQSYVESLMDIRDDELRAKAQHIIDSQKLWPDPLLQCNPGFKNGESIAELVDQDLLHPEMDKIFAKYILRKHQSEAIQLGAQNKGFIVTSGTGSGKSLTYLGTIFNSVLQRPETERKGVQAIIVYPMNALINSQFDSTEDLKREYEDQYGKHSFPINIKKYTGQEDDQEKKEVIRNPPHVLLTNYMMLELLLTRAKESGLSQAITDQLRFLVFDELHTYRGRQGADVALLIRRIKAHSKQKVVCIGTSATLSSGKPQDQKKEVAKLGQQLFDEVYTPEQIIGETLQKRIRRPLPEQEELHRSVSEDLSTIKDEKALLDHPLSCWMEQRIALQYFGETHQWLRGKPQTVKQIADLLSQDSGHAKDFCEEQLDVYLQVLQRINESLPEHRHFLPFRIHQFIQQTGQIKVTLESRGKRSIVQDDKPFEYKDGKRLPLFTVWFNRQSGTPYLPVTLGDKGVIPWDGESDPSEDFPGKNGYLILEENPQDPLWSAEREKELLPDSWMETKKSGTSIKKEKAIYLPQKIHLNSSGTRQKMESSPYKPGFWRHH
ncbi:DEAD/DEAH box helicase [bacterium SCSIO 12741]|nr:DEAD/DEAH box helicase [bacterium SCSIO 12741]